MFVIANPDYAKRLAKTLETELHEFGIDVGRRASLNLLASLWGFRDFAHLLSDGISSSPSLYDDECDYAETSRRREVQIQALRDYGLKEKLIPEFLAKVRPTERRTKPRDFSVDQVPEIVDLARKVDEHGDTASAAMILVSALTDSDRRQKSDVVSALDRLCLVEPVACYNLGIAYVNGDAGSRNLDTAATYLHACCSFGIGDTTHASALSVLGHIESLKSPDRTTGTEASLKFYRQAALTGKSPESAFNCGLYYARHGNYHTAAEYYWMAIEANHAPSMTNLALMIRNGQYDGDGDLMRSLFEKAAAQGDGAAHNAMRLIDRLVDDVDFPELAKANAQFVRSAINNPMLAQDLVDVIPVKQWIKVLSNKGWTLANVRTRISRDFEQIATAVGSRGTEIPIHITSSAHALGHREPIVIDAFERQHGEHGAILISNSIIPLNETLDPLDRYLCIGMIRNGEGWADLFLEEGGLDVALKQREALAVNPNLNKGKAFRCDDAEEIVNFLKESTMKKVRSLKWQ
jgi:hypothetical protein